jgi:hypothetical protein
MKHLIAALSFGVLATSVLADAGKPFEQLDLDRALPNIADRPATPVEYPLGGSAPYEQLAVDRALPNLPEKASPPAKRQVAASGNTRSDVEVATEASEESPWAKDHNFIAPPL